MSKKMLLVLVISVSLIGISACKSSNSGGNNGGGNGGGTAVENPSFANDVQTIFSNSCALATCHNVATAQAGLDLSNGAAYANTVNVASTSEPNFNRVQPSDADNSYIVIKLEGRQNVGGRMPASGSLSNAQIQTIKNWINQGAQNN
jgi:hypothetical protein